LFSVLLVNIPMHNFLKYNLNFDLMSIGLQRVNSKDGRTDGQTQTDRQADRHTDRQTDRHTDKHTHTDEQLISRQSVYSQKNRNVAVAACLGSSNRNKYLLMIYYYSIPVRLPSCIKVQSIERVTQLVLLVSAGGNSSSCVQIALLSLS
jgi:hypothetical protein